MKPTRVSLSSRIARVVAVLAYLGAAAPAWANEPTPTELAVARRLFKEATELEAEREWQLAASKLREAIQIKDTPGLRFHLAHCEEQLGMLVEALLDYERAAELIAGGAVAPDVEALLGPARRSLEARVPSLLIVIPAGVADLSAELNGRPLARSILGRPAPVNPGKYRVVVSAPGHSPFTAEVQIAEGERQRLQAELRPLAPASGPASTPVRLPPSPPQDTSGPGTLTYVLAGESAFTLAALGVGVGYLLVKRSAEDRAFRAQERVDSLSDNGRLSCGEPTPGELEFQESCVAFDDAADEYERARTLSIAGFIGAGVGAASLALTLALWPEEDKPPAVSANVTRDGLFFSISSSY